MAGTTKKAQTGSKTMAAPAAGSKRTMGATKLPPSVTLYLCCYNLFAFVGWLRILIGLVLYMLHGSDARQMMFKPMADFVEQYLPTMLMSKSVAFTHAHPLISTLLTRASTVHDHIGPMVVFVQSLAVLEVGHALLGWVKSNPIIVAIQVASRLLVVYGVTERYAAAAHSPWYAVLIFAWSLSEISRYPFYVNQLLDSQSYPAIWARYTMFIVLYPLGVLSEINLIWTSLPHNLAWPWVNPNGWPPRDLLFLAMLPVYIPGFLFLYSHMVAARCKVLGTDFAGSKGRAAVHKRQAEYLAHFRKLNEKLL